MKITEYISYTIDRLPKGYVFTYEDFIDEVKSKEAAIKALNRMVSSGKINKLSKGKYYKPETSPFGELAPPMHQVVKDLLEEDNKVIGYLTGLSIYNQLGLTTQVSHQIQIGRNEVRPSFKRDRYTISFIRQRNTITRENIPLLQRLDTIRYIKKIPDTTLSSSCKRLLVLIDQLSEADEKVIVRLSQKYPPATRALLGAMLQRLERDKHLDSLKNSLNPITTYGFKGIQIVLPTTQDWNIR